jgi:hypothetical protein
MLETLIENLITELEDVLQREATDWEKSVIRWTATSIEIGKREQLSRL